MHSPITLSTSTPSLSYKVQPSLIHRHPVTVVLILDGHSNRMAMLILEIVVGHRRPMNLLYSDEFIWDIWELVGSTSAFLTCNIWTCNSLDTSPTN